MGRLASPQPDAFERWHRRPASQKRLDEKPRRCSSPRCRSGLATVEGRTVCLDCVVRLDDLADVLRARAAARERT
jgi:hypothetical protein